MVESSLISQKEKSPKFLYNQHIAVIIATETYAKARRSIVLGRYLSMQDLSEETKTVVEQAFNAGKAIRENKRTIAKEKNVEIKS